MVLYEKRQGHRGGVKRRQPAEPGDTMSFKHKGDAPRWGWQRRGRSGRRGKEPHSLFAALSAGSLPFSVILPCHPPTYKQPAPFHFLHLFCGFVPLLIPIYFLYSGRHPLRYGCPSSFPPTVFCHSLALPLHPQALSRSLVSLYWTSLSFLPPIKMSETLLCFVCRFRFTRVHEPARFCK